MNAPSSDLPAGALVASRYEILERLGQGGMGTVYKARDRVLEETVALKVLRADLVGLEDFAHRFRQEIKLARRVRHKNVCAVHEFGEDGSMRYISMEFIEGADLRYMVRAAGGLPWPEAYDVSIQLTEGLQAIHDAGIIHRDLKTPNIMKDAKGLVRLMDFGIAKLGESETGGPMTVTGQILGTPEYMCPEQIRGEKIDVRIDIYALGVVIFEIFSGRVPFKGQTPVATIYKQLQEPPPFSETSRLPPSLVPVLRKALAKDREDRFGTAAEMGAELRRARETVVAEATVATTRPAVAPPPVANAALRCPLCSEPIKAGARKCPHCKEFLDPALKAEREHGSDIRARRALEKAELDEKVGQAFIGAVAGTFIASCIGPLGGPHCMIQSRQFTEKYRALELDPPPRVGKLRTVGIVWLTVGLLLDVGVAFNAFRTDPPAPAVSSARPARPAVAPLSEEGRLTKGCEGGGAADCYALATLYSSGGSGVTRDPARAVSFFSKACGGRHALACANLGFLSENGIGTAKDLSSAAAAYKKACALGEACEQYRRLGGTR